MQTKEKEILLDQIMGLLNTQRSAQDSLRFSQDYNLSVRGTYKDQLEEIDFKFLDQQDRLQQEMIYSLEKEEPTTVSNASQKVQTFGRNRQVIIDTKKEEGTTQTKKLKSKKSIKLSQQIQKKVQSRGSSDQFTKKYDNLFDEIFFNQKLKEEAHSHKSKQETKEQNAHNQKVIKTQGKPVTVQITKDKNKNLQVQPKIIPTASILLEQTKPKQAIADKHPHDDQMQHSLPVKSNSMQQSLSQPSLDIVEPKFSEMHLQSTHSISSQQSNVCDLLNKEILEVIVQNYAQNPTLVESLKPQVRINYNDKKPLVTFKPMNVLSPHTIRINPLHPAIRINPHNPTIRISPNNKNLRISSPNNPNNVIRISPTNPTIKIQTNNSFTQVKNSLVHPQISFNYKGPTTVLVKQAQKPQSPLLIKQSQRVQTVEFNQKQLYRLPNFLRKLRELTSSYPNFYSKQTLTTQNCNKLQSELVEAFNEVKKAIKKLKGAHLKYHDITQNIKRLYKQMTANITSSRKNDLKTLEFFKSSNWKIEEIFPELQDIKPHQIFQKRELNQLEFMTLLNSFDDIICNLENEPLLNLSDPQTIKIYMNARQKLWNFQKNLRLMSQDFYLKSILKINLPAHIVESHQILTKKRILNQQQKNRQVERLSFLQEKKDIFATCCLGQQTLRVLLEK